jgi:adenine-specific DNA-methyltransferase
MRYFGSKTASVGTLYQIVSDVVGEGILCDPFGGVGVVGAYFKARGYRVWAGDVLTFAHYFQVARIAQNGTPDFRTLRRARSLSAGLDVTAILNDAKSSTGWFVTEYSQKRRFFTLANARRIQGCLNLIDDWSRHGWLAEGERAVLLASLIECADRVANTAGTYYAYLKGWYRKASNPFKFAMIGATDGQRGCRSFLVDARELVAARAYDILYLDPPHNRRSYGRYYHLPETMARGKAVRSDRKSGVPDRPQPPSDFNRPNRAYQALEDLLNLARFRVLVLHYSDNGLIQRPKLQTLLRECGRVLEYVIATPGYTVSSTPRSVMQRIYLVHHG